MKRLPQGSQSFSKIIEDDFLYVDKTEHIYQMVTGGFAYFLSRPRRFGKSLLVSTLDALFQGRRELFSGLWIDSSDYSWEKHPVLRFDLSLATTSRKGNLSDSLKQSILDEASRFGIDGVDRKILNYSLSALVAELRKRFGRVVILIDEYDYPIVHNINNPDVLKENTEILREFLTTIKSIDRDLRFVFMTGVSNFSKVSLFSGMNNLIDISLDEKYSEIVGITRKEIDKYLHDHILTLSKKLKEDPEKTYDRLKKWYNGYNFTRSEEGKKLYNPYSLFCCLDSGYFENYWFSTATPKFAIDLIKKNDYEIIDLENGVIAGREIDVSHEPDDIDITTLLFQTGYLTIDAFDRETRTYSLKFPNYEVGTSFVHHLLNSFTEKSSNMNKWILEASRWLRNLNLENFFMVFNAFLSSIPYQQHRKLEAYYHSIIYTFVKVLGFDVDLEKSTSHGDIDMVVRTKSAIIVMEFKINKTSKEALNQILNKKYCDQFKNDQRKLIMVGVNFDSASRSINEWCTDDAQ